MVLEEQLRRLQSNVCREMQHCGQLGPPEQRVLSERESLSLRVSQKESLSSLSSLTYCLYLLTYGLLQGLHSGDFYSRGDTLYAHQGLAR